MINIKLDYGYCIKSDRLNWILTKKNNNYGYYSNIENLLQDYLMFNLRASNSKTIQELIKLQNSLIHTLNKALTPLKIKVVNLK